MWYNRYQGDDFMNIKLTKKDFLTIPNFLSLVRLLMIPIIIWLYIGKKDYNLTTLVIILSGLTDIVDGFIARTFNMVSDVGKVLDPIADKLTQATLMFCLASRYKLLWVPIIIFIIKESFMLLFGYITLEVTDKINSARWYGKVNTVVLYGVMAALIFFPSIEPDVASFLIGFCVAVMLVALILYISFYINILTEHSKKNQEN